MERQVPGNVGSVGHSQGLFSFMQAESAGVGLLLSWRENHNKRGIRAIRFRMIYDRGKQYFLEIRSDL